MIEIVYRKRSFDLSAETQWCFIDLIGMAGCALRSRLRTGRRSLMRMTLITLRMIRHRIADSTGNGLVTGTALRQLWIVSHLGGIHMILVREAAQGIGTPAYAKFALYLCKLYEGNWRAGVFVTANAPGLPFGSADPRRQKFILMTFDAGVMRGKTRRVIL
jgi:hypothetical protein